MMQITSDALQFELTILGLPPTEATLMAQAVNDGRDSGDLEFAWRNVIEMHLRPDIPFEVHKRAHSALFSTWDESQRPIPVWIPDPEAMKKTNLASLMSDEELDSYEELFQWSIEDRIGFWGEMIDRLGIRFKQKPQRIIADDANVETPFWLPGATLNIADSCFNAEPDSPAIVYANENGELKTMSLIELDSLTNRVANGLVAWGLKPGDAIAIDLMMTSEAVAIYLGIVRAGCVAVSIADSFAPAEIATRLQIAKAKAIFTQDYIIRGGKQLPLYEKVIDANAPKAIVLQSGESLDLELRQGDLAWESFLSDKEDFRSVACAPDEYSNILFSSGTTGDPKAIPWTHTSPIKCAADGWLHQDIRPGEIVAWP
ncbi:MAG: AMP-binding protein, partial [Planctomycetota bacterium]|nr:AMP-binding protein [Planctomycetota bacterium]